MQRRRIIKVKDKSFTVTISERAIKRQIKRIADQINRDYEGKRPVFLAVLNGSFIFAADLLREIDLPCEISFVKLASYEGTNTTGSVREVIGLGIDITNRPVIIVEDIVDSGVTLSWLVNELKRRGAASVEIFALLEKPARHQVQLDVKYKGFVIPDEFVVGFGLDFDEEYRNLDSIAVLKPEVYEGELA